MATRLGINPPAYSEQKGGLLRLHKAEKKRLRPHTKLRSHSWILEPSRSVSFAKDLQKNESSARSGVTKPNAPRFAGFQRNACAADSQKPMKSRAIKKLRGAVVAFAFVSGAVGIGIAMNAHAQTAAQAVTASMVKPPVVPSAANASGPHASNPDNMPTKRPALPPNSNRMRHNNPANDAIAK